MSNHGRPVKSGIAALAACLLMLFHTAPCRAQVGDPDSGQGFAPNPFQPVYAEEKAASPAAEPVDRKPPDSGAIIVDIRGDNPLQRWDLGRMRLLSVMRAERELIALVETPDGKPHVLRRGQSVGNRGGRVVEITLDMVRVGEPARLPDGRIVVEDRTLVPDDAGG
ncbi:MAG: pilus assembly protein PilP [Desulfatibacillaceae bacterium]